MTKNELALKTVAELRELAAGYGHKLSSRLKSGIVDELAGVIKKTRKGLKKAAKKTSKAAAKTVKTAKKAAKKTSKAAAKTVKAAKKAAKKTSKAAAKTVKTAKKAAKKASKETAKTVKAVKKAVAAGKKAAAAASKKKKAVSQKKTVKAKPSVRMPEKAAVKPAAPAPLEFRKKDLQGMTVPVLKETAKKLGVKHSYPTKDEFVTALAKDITKLRAEAKKKAAKAPAKPAAKPALKKAAAARKAPAAKAKARPAKPAAPKARKPSALARGKLVKEVKPAVQAVVEKAKALAVQVKETVSAIRPAKPKVGKKSPPARSAKEDLRDIAMPRVATVIPGEQEQVSSVELLAAIAVEPTELFVSWVLASEHKPSGPVILRVQEEGGDHFDVTVGGLSGSAYVRVRPGRHYYVDAGMIDAKGVFTTIRRSNPVATPPGEMQPLIAGEEGGEQALPDEFYTFIPQEYGS